MFSVLTTFQLTITQVLVQSYVKLIQISDLGGYLHCGFSFPLGNQPRDLFRMISLVAVQVILVIIVHLPCKETAEK
jgi:hypothetical protein